MQVRVRKARPDDAAVVADLVTQLGYPSHSQQVLARWRALDVANQELLVAEVGGAVVGLVHVNQWATVLLDDAAEIVALVVDEARRSQGIGRALLQAAEEWARQRGCSTLYVRTNVMRQRAHEFYFENGFQRVKTSLTLMKEL